MDIRDIWWTVQTWMNENSIFSKYKENDFSCHWRCNFNPWKIKILIFRILFKLHLCNEIYTIQTNHDLFKIYYLDHSSKYHYAIIYKPEWFIAWAVFSMCITNLYKFYYSLWCILFAAINLLSINPFVNNLPLHFPFAVMHNNNKWKINWIIFQEYFICWVAVNITICNFKIMDRYILKYQKPVVVILLCIYWINSQSAHWLCQRQDYKFNYFMSWELTK